MGKKQNKLWALLLAIAILISAIPVTTAYAGAPAVPVLSYEDPSQAINTVQKGTMTTSLLSGKPMASPVHYAEAAAGADLYFTINKKSHWTSLDFEVIEQDSPAGTKKINNLAGFVLRESYGVTFSDPELSSIEPDKMSDYRLIAFTEDFNNYVHILVHLSSGSGEPADKTRLDSLINEVTGTNVDNWYPTDKNEGDDRYNGKAVSASGFWADMLPVLENAKQVFANESADQASVDSAAGTLEAAIAKLISKENVNATLLYEYVKVFTPTPDGYLQNGKIDGVSYSGEIKKADYPAARWNAFSAAYEAAAAMLDALYDGGGAPTALNRGPNAQGTAPAGAIEQEAVDAAAAAITGARGRLVSSAALSQIALERSLIGKLNEMFPMTDADASKYTEGSWAPFKSAKDTANALLAQYPTEESIVSGVGSQFQTARTAFRDAGYGLTEKGEITVHLTVCDNVGAIHSPYAFTDGRTAAFRGSVTLADGKHSVSDVAGHLIWNYLVSESQPFGLVPVYMLYINGVLVNEKPSTASTTGNPGNNVEFEGINLRDGDNVTILRVQMPGRNRYGAIIDVGIEIYNPYLAMLRFDEAASATTAKEGESFDVRVMSTGAYLPSYTGQEQPSMGKQIIAYGPYEENGTCPAAPILTGAFTDGSGIAKPALYRAGKYALIAVDTREMDMDAQIYPNIAGGAYMEVTVTPLDGSALDAVKADYIKELDALLDPYSAGQLGAVNWAAANEAVADAKAAVTAAQGLAVARDALQTARDTVAALAKESINANEVAINTMTAHLVFLPSASDVAAGKFSQGDTERMDDAIGQYDSMNGYQRQMLTGQQTAQWKALTDAYGEDGSGLPEAIEYTVTVKADRDDITPEIVGITNVYNRIFSCYAVYWQDWFDRFGEYHNDHNYAYAYINSLPTTGTYSGADNAVEISVSIYDSPGYECYGVEVEGWTGSVVESVRNADPATGKAYTTYTLKCMGARDDITFTLLFRSAGEIETIRSFAKAELAGEYAKYKKADYTTAGWASLTAAYNDGLAAIEAAENEDAVNAALAGAIAAMQAVKTRAQDPGDPGPAEGTYGSVRVTVENTTYPDAPLTGIFVDEDVPLEADTTMMTAVLDALGRAGYYDWNTTMTYLALVYKDENGNGKYDKNEEPGLAEFDGGSQSGWMGTLNDWFTNEGFQSFAVGASNRNYRLTDGDHIAVMYTRAGFGSDLGGSWTNSDTSLKELDCGGGTLSPAFKGGTHSYIMAASGGSVELMPVAANKNYQMRIYLNEKSGDNWYRKGESIPVKAGDVINIGIGERSWPSMNNQGSEAIPYTGTWYEIRITDSSNAGVVASIINAIPTVTYQNYKAQADKVAAARIAYNELSQAAKDEVAPATLEKLTDAEAKIQSFTEIDNVKALLAAIPAADKLTTGDKSKVEAAGAAYDSLTDEQKLYITTGDVEKYNAAVVWFENQGINVSVTVGGTAAQAAGSNAFTALLPYGSDTVALRAEDIVIESSEPGAECSLPETNDGGKTWTFTVSIPGRSRTYTLTVTVAQNPVYTAGLSAQSGSANTGGSLAVDVTLSGWESFSALEMDVIYESGKVGYESASFPGDYTVTDDAAAGRITVTRSGGPADTGTLGQLVFRVKNEVEHNDSVSFGIGSAQAGVTQEAGLTEAVAGSEAVVIIYNQPEAVIQVIDLIGAIGQEVTLEKGPAIGRARTGYDGLDPDGKAAVTNYPVLTGAEAAYGRLVAEATSEALGYVRSQVPAPEVGYTFGEWAVLALARGGAQVPEGYYDGYFDKAAAYAAHGLEDGQRFNVATEYARIILALTAIGRDPSQVGGHNLLKGLSDFDYAVRQGVNGPVFALIALDANQYAIPAVTGGTQTTRGKLIDHILSKQLPDGGWQVQSASAEVDTTAMALQALAPYYRNEAAYNAIKGEKTYSQLREAVEKALATLKRLQNENGGYGSFGTGSNSEGVSQVIVALTALGIDPKDKLWTTANGGSTLTALFVLRDETTGGFKHTAEGGVNQMASEQASYALVAYARYLKGQNSLYDMRDALASPENEEAVAAAKAAIEGRTWTVGMAEANNSSAIKTRIEEILGGLDLDGVDAAVTVKTVSPAIAGTASNKKGTDGSFTFTADLSKGSSAGRTGDIAGRITATVYISADTSLRSVEIGNTQGEIKGREITVVLDSADYPALPTDSGDIKISTRDPNAKVKDLATGDEGETWTFTVTAEDGTTEDYTIHVSITDDPKEIAEAALRAAKAAIENDTYAVSMDIAGSDADVKTWLKQKISDNQGTYGVSVSVAVYDFNYAVAGTADSPQGTNGSFRFEAELEKEYEADSVIEAVYATASNTGIILAIEYTQDSAVAALKGEIAKQDWTLAMSQANTEQSVKSWAEARIAQLNSGGVRAGVVMNSFTPAVAGTAAAKEGREGSFSFTVTLSKGQGTAEVMDSLQVTGAITATPYSGGGTPNPATDIKVSFRLIGATRSSEDIDLELSKGDYKGSEYVTWIKTSSYTLDKGSTVYDLFLAAVDLKSVGADKNYVKTIYAPEALGGYKLSEFTNGQYSGWMYTVNGKHPGVGLKDYELKNNDKVIWHYVNDYRYEVEDWFEEEGGTLGDSSTWSKWLKAADTDPSKGGAGNTPNKDSEASKTSIAPKVTAKDGTAAVSLSASELSAALAAVKENNKTTLVIAPEITGTAHKVSVELPKASLSSLVSGTGAGLEIDTPVGTVTIPRETLSNIVSQASGSTLTVSVEAVEKKALTEEQQKLVGDSAVFDISITSGGKHISSFDGKSVTISLPYTLKAGENADGVTVWYLNDKGELEQITCKYDAKTGQATFTTTHLSHYMVGYSAEAPWVNPFRDVKATDWFYAAVKYAVQNELFTGTADTTFDPGAEMTRSMLVTVLCRLEGKPQVAAANSFTDVKSGQWYTDAVLWANANGIVEGYGSELFGTNDPITREQMASILHRYASYKGYDVTAATNLNAYTDAADISSWAQTAMSWANAEGLITGRTTTTLASGGTATRAEVASILKRFVEGFVK